jgi:hypothetical protein
MIINGKWMNEPEIKSLISQLTADKKRLEKKVEQCAKRGEMIPLTVEEEIKFYKSTGNHFDGRCSECGSCVFDTDNFCAECGADMRKDETT